jgi:hypothetical protein
MIDTWLKNDLKRIFDDYAIAVFIRLVAPL